MLGLHVNRNKMKAIQLEFIGCAQGAPARLELA
jgi:hypothetical protein